jgi:hypothetical protein
MSSERFSLDGTMMEAWASQNSFWPKKETSNDAEA